MEKTSLHGDVVPRLRYVLVRAQETWNMRLTQKDLAFATGLDPKTISAFVNQRTKRYDEHTLGIFCWYFGCEMPDQLLSRIPVYSHATSPYREVHIGRKAPPSETPPQQTRLIRSTIAEKVAGSSVEEIVKTTGLARNTVKALLDEEEPMKRIARSTLAAIYTFLEQQHGQEANTQSLFLYVGPSPWKK